MASTELDTIAARVLDYVATLPAGSMIAGAVQPPTIDELAAQLELEVSVCRQVTNVLAISRQIVVWIHPGGRYELRPGLRSTKPGNGGRGVGVVEQVGEIIDRQPNNGGLFSVGFDDEGAVIVRFGGPIAALGLQRLAAYQQTLQEAGFHVEQMNFPQRQGLPKRPTAGTRPLHEHRVGLAERAHLRVTTG